MRQFDIVLKRDSKALEGKQPDNSVLMLEKAVETVKTENRPIQVWQFDKALKRDISLTTLS